MVIQGLLNLENNIPVVVFRFYVKFPSLMILVSNYSDKHKTGKCTDFFVIVCLSVCLLKPYISPGLGPTTSDFKDV